MDTNTTNNNENHPRSKTKLILGGVSFLVILFLATYAISNLQNSNSELEGNLEFVVNDVTSENTDEFTSEEGGVQEMPEKDDRLIATGGADSFLEKENNLEITSEEQVSKNGVEPEKVEFQSKDEEENDEVSRDININTVKDNEITDSGTVGRTPTDSIVKVSLDENGEGENDDGAGAVNPTIEEKYAITTGGTDPNDDCFGAKGCSDEGEEINPIVSLDKYSMTPPDSESEQEGDQEIIDEIDIIQEEDVPEGEMNDENQDSEDSAIPDVEELETENDEESVESDDQTLDCTTNDCEVSDPCVDDEICPENNNYEQQKIESETIEANFSDLLSDHWAYEAIAHMNQTGIMKGYADSDYFGVNDPLKRWQFAIILSRLDSQINVSNSNSDDPKNPVTSYSDLNSSDPGYKEIIEVSMAGYMEGNPDGTFGGNRDIKREEMAIALTRFLEVDLKNYQKGPIYFRDVEDQNAWFTPPLRFVRGNNYMNGYEMKDENGNSYLDFGLGKNISRGETAVVWSRVMKEMINAQ